MIHLLLAIPGPLRGPLVMLAALGAFLLAFYGPRWGNRSKYGTWSPLARELDRQGPAPTEPERDDSGADETYGDDLEQLRHSEKELASLAAELNLNILDEEQRAWAVDALDLRLMVAEDIDHFSQRLGGILDDFAPGWLEETPTTALPTFRAVHALVDETGEFAVVGS